MLYTCQLPCSTMFSVSQFAVPASLLWWDKEAQEGNQGLASQAMYKSQSYPQLRCI